MGSQNTLAQLLVLATNLVWATLWRRQKLHSKVTHSLFPHKAWSCGCPYNLDSQGNPKAEGGQSHNCSLAPFLSHQVTYQ